MAPDFEQYWGTFSIFARGEGWTRARDPEVMSLVSYQLLYLAMFTFSKSPTTIHKTNLSAKPFQLKLGGRDFIFWPFLQFIVDPGGIEPPSGEGDRQGLLCENWGRTKMRPSTTCILM